MQFVIYPADMGNSSAEFDGPEEGITLFESLEHVFYRFAQELAGKNPPLKINTYTQWIDDIAEMHGLATHYTISRAGAKQGFVIVDKIFITSEATPLTIRG